MHFVIHTQYYPPEVGAPQTRLSELAQRMVARGHRVTVLTAMPNYPTGKIHRGYSGLVRREKRGGVRVLRTFIYPTQKADFLHRLSNYFSFVFSSAIFGALLLPSCDYLLTESPPLFLGPAGALLAKLKGARFIFNVSDLWPESAVQLDLLRRGSKLHRLAEKIEAFCYARAWLVTGQSKSILQDIEKRFPSQRTFHLSNGADTKRFAPQLRSEYSRAQLAPKENANRPLALYAGLHGLAQGLEQILDAAEKLGETCDFVLIGDGPQKAALQEQAARQNLSNVTFLPSRPSREIPPLVASADIVLITLKSLITGAVPSKLYEAMASGVPVVLAASGEAADIVREGEAGLVVAPGDTVGLRAAIQTLADDADLRQRLGENGRRVATQHFDRDQIAARFIDFLEGERQR